MTPAKTSLSLTTSSPRWLLIQEQTSFPDLEIEYPLEKRSPEGADPCISLAKAATEAGP